MLLKRFTTFVLSLLALQVYGQKEGENYYLFDSAWKGTLVIAEAKYFTRIKPVGDSLEQWDIYNMHGPLIRIETNKKGVDGDAHGQYSWYDEMGFIDSLGSFTNGIRTGDWYYYDDKGRVTNLKRYLSGLLIYEENYAKESLDEEEPSEDKRTESRFKGGNNAWRFFLDKNLRYPKGAKDRGIMGTVRVQFTIDEDGIVSDPWIAKSVELSLDDESMRIIMKSPRWLPGMRDGEKIKTYKVQSFNFIPE